MNHVSTNLSPTVFEQLVLERFNIYCPEKIMKLGDKDKPFITAQLKVLHRRKSREYVKRGKSPKYLTLKKKFEELYKVEAKKYLEKTLGELKESNPGKISSILKRLGASPAEIGNDTFILPSHENLTADQSAEKIANHFASISQEFASLDESLLPPRVQSKLQKTDKPPLNLQTMRPIC